MIAQKRRQVHAGRYADRVQEFHIFADAGVIDAISSYLHSIALLKLPSLHLTSTWNPFVVVFGPVVLVPNLRQLHSSLDLVAVHLDAIAHLMYR